MKLDCEYMLWWHFSPFSGLFYDLRSCQPGLGTLSNKLAGHTSLDCISNSYSAKAENGTYWNSCGLVKVEKRNGNYQLLPDNPAMRLPDHSLSGNRMK